MNRRAFFLLPGAAAAVVPAVVASPPKSPTITMKPHPMCCEMEMVRIARHPDRWASAYGCFKCRRVVEISDIVLENIRLGHLPETCNCPAFGGIPHDSIAGCPGTGTEGWST